jgi:hypothetical protein
MLLGAIPFSGSKPRKGLKCVKNAESCITIIVEAIELSKKPLVFVLLKSALIQPFTQ